MGDGRVKAEHMLSIRLTYVSMQTLFLALDVGPHKYDLTQGVTLKSRP